MPRCAARDIVASRTCDRGLRSALCRTHTTIHSARAVSHTHSFSLHGSPPPCCASATLTALAPSPKLLLLGGAAHQQATGLALLLNTDELTIEEVCPPTRTWK